MQDRLRTACSQILHIPGDAHHTMRGDPAQVGLHQQAGELPRFRWRYAQPSEEVGHEVLQLCMVKDRLTITHARSPLSRLLGA